VERADYVPIEAAIDDLKTLPLDPAFNHNGTRHGKPMIERLSRLAPGASLYPTFRDAWKRQHKGVPSMAIKENHGGVHVHYELNRVLTAREMARLQTFPDDFFFEGRFKRVYWQIGNAVPCLFAEHLGRAVALQLRASGLMNS
jgi:DNA (cytosine-5)-methyltransferase 1